MDLARLYYGTGGDHGEMPFTVMMPARTEIEGLLRQSLARFEASGVRLAVLISGHFAPDQVAMVEEMAAEWNARGGALRVLGLAMDMSGLPAGSPGDTMPNWVVASWPPETQTILKYQWDDVLLPYWDRIATLARSCGVERIALELHGNQCVYNVPSLLRLRKAVGPVVGANLDPSHLFWMGADPLAAVDALGEAVYHVHAKDTLLNAPVQAVTSLLENGSLTDIPARAWSYITLGHGHGEVWWRQFTYRLLMAGYQGWLSIEHEDVLLNSLEGLEMSVRLLQGVMPTRPADFKPQAI